MLLISNTSKAKGHGQFESEEGKKRCILNKGTKETWCNYDQTKQFLTIMN